MKIPTFDTTGKPNGYVIPVWNAKEKPELRPDQVYLTAVAPHSSKGPHLHKQRRGMFCCIKGNVRVVLRRPDSGKLSQSDAGRLYYRFHYETRYSGEKSDYRIVLIPPGIPACIYNDGDEEALVINMPSPAWSADDPDEWPVEGWEWM